MLAVLILAPALRAQEVTYDGSLHYSTGDYLFTERTNSAYFFNGIRVAWDRVTLSAGLPVIWQSTPWISYTPGVPVPTGGPQQGDVADSLQRRKGGGSNGGGSDGDGSGDGTGSGNGGNGAGPGGPGGASAARAPSFQQEASIPLEDTVRYDEIGAGDPTFRLAVEVVRETDGSPSVTLSGTVKPPLADPDRGFGTGAWDGGASLGLSKRVGEAFLFADLGYWVYGDMEDIELKDPVSYGAGVGLVPGGGKVGLMATLSGSSEILEETDPPLEVGLGVNVSLAGRRSLSAMLSFGLSESSPDVAAGFGWSLGL